MSQDFDFTDPSDPVGKPVAPTPPPAVAVTPTPPPPPARKPTPVAPAVDPLYRSPISVGAGLLVILALLGGLGYLGYDSYKNPPAAAPTPEATTAPTPAAPAPGGMAAEAPASAPANQVSEVAGEVAALKTTLQSTAEQVAALTARPAPDMKPIEDRISEMGKATEPLAAKITALEEKVAAMGKAEPADASKIEAQDKKIADLTAQLDTLKASVAEMSKVATTPAAEPARPVADVNTADAAMSQAADLFEQKKYAESLQLFTKLQADHPDDARVWYYSALARGMASREWQGETERLVLQGVEKEKAGMPEKGKIDAVFASLTTANGKAWLAAYRARAASR